MQNVAKPVSSRQSRITEADRRRRMTSSKDPDRHRRAYEAAGQLWPENLGKHLRRASALEAAEQVAADRREA